jgi:hypothetical protein
MNTYQQLQLNAEAIISGPVHSFSTRYKLTKEGVRGLRVTLYRVDINGHPAYHAPSKALCHEWLVRHGFWPKR